MKEEATDQARTPDPEVVDGPNSAKISYTNLALHGRSLNKSPFRKLRALRDTYGHGYLQVENRNVVYRLDGPQARTIVLQQGAESGVVLRSYEVNEVIDGLQASALLAATPVHVWHRVAPISGGIEIDVGGIDELRIQVTREGVKVVPTSDTRFVRPLTMRELVLPASSGTLNRLAHYLNLSPSDALLLKAWISYVLAHPKIETTAFPIVVLIGDQGSGKTFLCRIVERLIDPNTVGLRMLPRTPQDLALGAQQSHLLMFDNVREIKPYMADALCVAATGGVVEARRLYTDSETVANRLHVAVVINGIHAFINQPDLAQRCLPLRLRTLEERQLRSESALMRMFETELPGILRGLLDLISAVFAELPRVEATYPERLIGFSHWLAAMEKVDGKSCGEYQLMYRAALDESMRDSLMEHPVAAAVLDLIEASPTGWSGTPTDLLKVLDRIIGQRACYSADWPRSANSLSKQLRPLQAGLRRQGVDVRLSRSKTRLITIARVEEVSHD